MLTWDQAQTLCQRITSDTDTTTTLPFLKQSMNLGYQEVLGELGRSVIERTQTAQTVASQQYYQLPPDYLYTKSITVQIGSISYPMEEVTSQEQWNMLNATTVTTGLPTNFFVRPKLGHGGAEIGLWPIPSEADNLITLVYEATGRDLTADAYTTGTVTATQNSYTLTGSGTTFTSPMIGRYFAMTAAGTDGMWYKVTAINSPTEIELENYYEGPTLTGTYSISEVFALPEEMMVLPAYYAIWLYYESKEDEGKALKFRTLYDNGLKMGKARHGLKTRSAKVRDYRSLGWKSSYPGWWPQNIT